METGKTNEFGIELTKANEITKGLDVIKAEREMLIDAYKDIIDLEINEETIPQFKSLRLLIVKNRTQGINKWHSANKEFFLTGGRFVDAIKNKEIAINEGMEKALLLAEKHFENIEKKRIADLQEKRVELLTPFVDDAGDRLLSDMDQDVWEAYLMVRKNDHNAKIEAEKQAEKVRIQKEKDEAEERLRVKKENDQLKKEADERIKAEKIEIDKRAKIEAERVAKQKEVDRINQEKIDQERIEKDAILKAERLKRERVERELKVKKEAEIEAKEIAEREIQFDLNKGDKFKVNDLKIDLTLLKTKYSFKSAKNKKMYSDIQLLIDKVLNHIK